MIKKSAWGLGWVLIALPGLSLAQEKGDPSSRRLPLEERAVENFDLGVNKVNYVHARFPELTGAGLGASVKEQRMDSTDIDFRDRHIPSAIGAPLVNTHSTTMATIIGGAGNSFYTGKGVAPGAGLSSASFFNLFPDDPLYFLESSLTVQNHSYGLDIENFYGAEAVAYDRQVYDHPELVHVFSAGNAGASASLDGPYAGVEGFANLTGTMKMAKNVLTVGAVDSFFRIEDRSSRGPAFDGRLKPELVAFGQDGSSGAAAITSGTVLLLQQAYQDRYGGELPPSALIRAALLNSADDLGNPGPDFIYGYGNLDAPGAIRTIREGRFFSASIGDKEILDFPVSLPAGAVNLKVTLAWTDPPGLQDAGIALVNDLGLLLIQTFSGKTWEPWVLHPAPQVDSLKLPAVRGADRLNNQEQVTLAKPEPGNYRMQVRGDLIPAGVQEFFLVYEWDSAGRFEWTFPTRLDHVRPGESMPVRWESTLEERTGKIEFAFAGSEEWRLIDEQVDLSRPYLQWTPPDTLALAQLRLTAGDRVVLSDTFSISRALEMSVGFNCEEELLLYWEREEAAAGYGLYALVSERMEPVLTTADTFVILDKSEFPFDHFAIRPLMPAAGEGVRSLTLNLAFQNAGCFIRSFSARLAEDRAELELTLGSLYGVEKIRFEKRTEEGFVLFDSRLANESLTYRYTDADLQYANNIYRAGVELTDGSVIYSDEVSIFFLAENNYALFPNPVYAGQDIVVLSNLRGGEYLYLFDALGRLVLKYDLLSGSETLETRNLASGIYFYQVILEGEKLAAGKIVVR